MLFNIPPLTAVEEWFLAYTVAGINGGTVCAEEPSLVDLSEVFHLSETHKLLPLVFKSAYTSVGKEMATAFDPWKSTVRHQVVGQARRSRMLLGLLTSLRESGFSPIVVKGILCRDLYRTGDYRPSSDEDLWIGEREFSACCTFLAANGWQRLGESAPDAVNEMALVSPDHMLYIELHRVLFTEDHPLSHEFNRLFAGSENKTTDYVLGEGTVRSLSPHDHLLYMILHAYKHFIRSGFGIRQVCDIALWLKKYGDSVDMLRLLSQCESVGADVFASCVFRIARDSMGIDIRLPAEWEYPEVDPAPMLADLLRGGIYGSSEADRLHAGALTAERTRGGGIRHVLFPSVRTLAGRYPVLDKYPFFLPLVWVVRLCRYVRSVLNGTDADAKAILQVAETRTKLLDYYGIGVKR